MTDTTIEDGFGSEWAKCTHPLCDLHVCRPGKAQCNKWCDYIDAMGCLEVSAAHIDTLLDHISWQRDYIRRIEDAGDE